jgi:hypothetical protein
MWDRADKMSILPFVVGPTCHCLSNVFSFYLLLPPLSGHVVRQALSIYIVGPPLRACAGVKLARARPRRPRSSSPAPARSW